ncbi:MAG: DNA-directed RNA polymerase subunit alpha [Armatimonadota bacterium]|nr:DNA-directed RNA polymerase subunit alpha [Armatimonadota bacterium]MDR5697099.1 DNA-directed RNA polymerase subunit alpha [Armatimonadota bacterium]
MWELSKPRVEYAELSDTYGKLVVEPLDRGFGTTIGNALRRVLLSSVPGAAVTSVKIEGVLHEFSTVPGVVEDVTQIILNLKELTLRLHTDKPKLLRLEAKGKREVTAGDIQPDAEVEILNPDLPIATIDKRDAKLSMEIVVERGKGYVPAEKHRKSEHVIGVIPVDSIFSPVQKVNYVVEDTHVGIGGELERLVLEVWTNGAVRPDDAIAQSSKLLIDHFRLISGIGEEDGSLEAASGDPEQARLLASPIEDLELSVRPYNCLKRANIHTIGDLVQRTEEEIANVKNFGRKSLEEVVEKLAAVGLSLKKRG